MCVRICLQERVSYEYISFKKESLVVLLVNKNLTATVLQTEQGEHQAKMFV